MLLFVCTHAGSANSRLPQTVGSQKRQVNPKLLCVPVELIVVWSIVFCNNVLKCVTYLLFLSWQPRSIVRGNLPSLAAESSVTIKENIDTTHSKDIPAHSRTGENIRPKLGSLPCELVLMT